jgi:transglutaminase-like putative cysteine protease
MNLQVTHETCYDYDPAVDNAQHMVYLQPCNTVCQTLLAHSLFIDPPPAQQMAMQDVFGNTRQFFALQAEHNHLTVVAHSVVQTLAPAPALSKMPWELARERFRYSAKSPIDAAAEFVFASPYVPRSDEFAAYAVPSFSPNKPLLEGARSLMQRIHRDFTYESQSTQVDTPALKALAQRKGVCQDFAHIMIACLRALGLPARYVSGYLLTQPEPGKIRLQGADASHAWASVYVPDLCHARTGLPGSTCWYDLDPTNSLDGWGTPGSDYITLAIGRDYGDVSPVRGVIHGGANHTLSVGVTVEPIDLPNNQSQSQSQSQFTIN